MSWENKKRKKEEKREKCEDGERDREKYIERLREWRKGNKKKKGEDSDDLFVHDCILWELRTTPLFSTSQPSSPLCSVAELARPQLKPVSSCLSCGCLAGWLASHSAWPWSEVVAIATAAAAAGADLSVIISRSLVQLLTALWPFRKIKPFQTVKKNPSTVETKTRRIKSNRNQ